MQEQIEQNFNLKEKLKLDQLPEKQLWIRWLRLLDEEI